MSISPSPPSCDYAEKNGYLVVRESWRFLTSQMARGPRA